MSTARPSAARTPEPTDMAFTLERQHEPRHVRTSAGRPRTGKAAPPFPRRSKEPGDADRHRRITDAHRQRDALVEVVSASCVERGANARRVRVVEAIVAAGGAVVVEKAVIDVEPRLAEDAPL